MINEDNLEPIEKYLPNSNYLYDFFTDFIKENKEFYVYCDEQTVSTHISQVSYKHFNTLKSFCLPEKPYTLCSEEEKKLFIREDEDDLSYFNRLKSIYLNKFGAIFEIDYLKQYLRLNINELKTVLIKKNLKEIPANTKNIFFIEDNFFNPPEKFYGTNKEKLLLRQIFFLKNLKSGSTDYYCEIDNKTWIVSSNFDYIINYDNKKIGLNDTKATVLGAAFKLYHSKGSFQSIEVMSQLETSKSYKYLSQYLLKNEDISIFFQQLTSSGKYKLSFPKLDSFPTS